MTAEDNDTRSAAEAFAHLLAALEVGRDLTPEWLVRWAPGGDIQHLWATCQDARLLLRLTSLRVERRAIIHAAVACALPLASLLPAEDTRPLDALHSAMAWAEGEVDWKVVATSLWKAEGFLRSVIDDVGPPEVEHAAKAMVATAKIVVGPRLWMAALVVEEAAKAAAEFGLGHASWHEIHRETLAVLADVVRLHVSCPPLDEILRNRSGPDRLGVPCASGHPPSTEDSLGEAAQALVRIGFASTTWTTQWRDRLPEAWSACVDARLMLWLAVPFVDRMSLVLAAADCLRFSLESIPHTEPAVATLIGAITRLDQQQATMEDVENAAAKMDPELAEIEYLTEFSSPAVRLSKAALALVDFLDPETDDDDFAGLADEVALAVTAGAHPGYNIDRAVTQVTYRDSLARLATIIRRRVPYLPIVGRDL